MGEIGNITNARSLFTALDGRESLGEDERAAFDARIWKACGDAGAVLVTDLSGFTRLTQKRGIVHFLSMFRRFQRSCAPVINKHGGSLLKQEADDLIGLFVEATDAIDAGVEMLRLVEALNEGAGDDERIGLCVGVEYGRMLRLSDDAYGDPVNVAFKLGEDVADAGEVLVGQAAMARAQAQGYAFDGVALSDERVVETGKVPLVHFAVTLS